MRVSSAAALAKHLRYISRDSAMHEADKGKVFDRSSDDADTDLFTKDAEQDRHHFRFIVSPEDGHEMADLKPFVRDLMTEMEQDLKTRLDWVAAIHHDTAHPHAHIALRGRRDDGSDLVIPRAYISHTMRERATNLVTIELGPETKLERDLKLARETRHERLTRIDRGLLKLSDENMKVDVGLGPAKYRQINTARLRVLEQMKLAKSEGRSVWKLDARLRQKLKAMGERGDIIKSLNRALAERTHRRLDPDFSLSVTSEPVRGAVLHIGVSGQYHDRAYAILDTLDGRAVRIDLGPEDQKPELRKGMIVSVSAPAAKIKPADRTIDEIARANLGTYSAALHQDHDPRARPEFIAAHVRRLEAVRRAGHVRRMKDGTWRVPVNYLEKALSFEQNNSQSPSIEVESYLPLNEQITDQGLTWLDHQSPGRAPHIGFSAEAEQARRARQQQLVERDLLARPDDRLTAAQKLTLKELGMDHAAKHIAKATGKSHKVMPQSGSIEGKFTGTINTGHGRYAILERNRSFTLAPWRQIMERRRGLSISGTIRGGRVSWRHGQQRTRGRGIAR